MESRWEAMWSVQRVRSESTRAVGGGRGRREGGTEWEEAEALEEVDEALEADDELSSSSSVSSSRDVRRLFGSRGEREGEVVSESDEDEDEEPSEAVDEVDVGERRAEEYGVDREGGLDREGGVDLVFVSASSC